MKLLLTSAGVTKRSIADSLASLVGKSPSDTKIGYVPIAANAESGNKDWYINQFLNFWRFGYNWIDVIDPTAAGVNWKERLADVDVVFVSGGNTFHLLDQMRKTKFDEWLQKNLETKVYIGVSAGTIVVTPTIEIASMPPADPNLPHITDLTGLQFVDFEIEPHCNQERFLAVETYAKQRSSAVYAIDDQSAIIVDNENVTVVSEGSWQVYKK